MAANFHIKLCKLCILFPIVFVMFILSINLEITKSKETSWFNEEKPISLARKKLASRNKEKNLQKAMCLLQGTLDRGSFCLDKENLMDGGSFLLDGMVCKEIEKMIGYASIVDFGAGLGQYGRCFLRKVPKISSKRHNSEFRIVYKHLAREMIFSRLMNAPPVIKSWEGYDGGTLIEELSLNLVKHIELSQPFDLGRKFDWVLSLEVGEHIPEQYEEVFVSNLVKHANKGVIISWAIPGQVGKGHINLRSNDYIINKMNQKGLVHDKENQDLIRNVSQFSYFGTNLMVFRKMTDS